MTDLILRMENVLWEMGITAQDSTDYMDGFEEALNIVKEELGDD